jgi:hypothetical protein
MADDRTNRGPADRARVNIHEEYELRYWAEKFGVSAEELKRAVGKVGAAAVDVESALGNKADRHAGK